MPVFPRTNFNSSPLVRLLAGMDLGAAAGSKQTIAERMSQWLAWNDAIALSGALGSGPGPGASTAALPLGAAAVTAALARVRSDLARAITLDAPASADLSVAPSASAPAAPTPTAADAIDWTSCRRHLVTQQQAMESRIATLRAPVRAALAAHSPALAKLAALDAVFEKALAPRERQLLATVPGLLAGHPTGDAAQALQTLHSVLMAELDTRLQPVEGMIEALVAACGGDATRHA